MCWKELEKAIHWSKYGREQELWEQETLYMTQKIYNKIKELLRLGKNKFVIYPFGERGKELKAFLGNYFEISNVIFMDNNRCGKDGIISCKDISIKLDEEYIILLCSDNRDIHYQLREELLKHVSINRVIEILLDKPLNIELVERIKNGEKTRVIFNPIFKSSIITNQMVQVGDNTGNLVFSEAIKRNVRYDYEVFLSYEWTREYLGKQNVKAIMPAANFLGRGTTWIESYIPLLEKTDMGFTLAGLGAQARLSQTPKDVVAELSSNQKRFFSLVSERAKSIGVRGAFTAECLELMGIKNVDVIGCPSFYRYESCYEILKYATMDRVMCTLSRGDIKVYDFAHQAKAKIVCQTYDDIDDRDKNIFFDYDEWSKFMFQNNFSFAFGTRFHGNMMALNHGVPTLWLVHDWRTRELVEYLKLPHMELYGEFQKIKHPIELIEYCDYTEVYKNYAMLYKRYHDFIEKNFE